MNEFEDDSSWLGSGFKWVVPEEHQNLLGADRRIWGDSAPPVTSRVKFGWVNET